MSRTIRAVAAAMIAASVAYAVVLGIAMRPLSGGVVPWAMLFAPGLLWGALFSVAVLAPLSHLMRYFAAPNRALFIGAAITAWCVISALLFASRGLSVAEVVSNLALVLPAGLAAVFAFVFVALRPAA
jgi:hypothetical protein